METLYNVGEIKTIEMILLQYVTHTYYINKYKCASEMLNELCTNTCNQTEL